MHVLACLQMKPWSEFVQRDAFSKPEGFSDAISKIRKNIRYFKFNYLTLTFGVTALTFVRDPGSLSVLIALAAMWFYLLIMRKEPLKINGRQLGQREQVLGAGAISFLVVFFLSSVGSELMYALFLSSALVAAHGSFRVPDELFLEEDVESAATLVPPTTSASLQSAMAQIGITAASS